METSDVIDTDQGNVLGTKSNMRDLGPAFKQIHETGFEIQHSIYPDPYGSNVVDDLIHEEIKIQEMKQSIISGAYMHDEESSEEYKTEYSDRKNKIKNLAEEFQIN